MRGIYLAGAAMAMRETQQDALAYNLANAGTPGFKASRVFSEMLEETADAETVRDAARSGRVTIDFSQGVLLETGRPLDFAIEGKGFFVVQTPEGERYTRNGSFTVDPDGRLVTGTGEVVLGEGGPIVVGSRGFSIGPTGEILLDGEPAGRLLVRTFDKPEDLERLGPGLFGPRADVRIEEVEGAFRIRQGCLESSNVGTFDEMVRMTILMRNYEWASRAVQMRSAALGRTVNELIER